MSYRDINLDNELFIIKWLVDITVDIYTSRGAYIFKIGKDH